LIKAIIYDLDGVLVDATEWHYESLNEALMEVAGFKITREEYKDGNFKQAKQTASIIVSKGLGEKTGKND
jgi:beta-phosphoglucomutase-like phosphatase (HAD superfamily)